MEQIGAVQLGNITNKKFLTGIIPKEWEEIVYEHDKFWTCRVKRRDINKKSYSEQEYEYKVICESLIEELGDYLMEIYGINGVDTGDHFVVYLRK